ncbi:protein of unknown function [Geodermatophilus amargosae]|uniref:Uncharacterized protein n=1 Tax=Geodermatophilus amargosae TaxID=1296565 RepID=A0A1I7CU45_9ACTN|nr:nitroreductase/quinone reductase family protein [Geodermatophilus amargosae]SFU02951.1 protein of unknown function [Geodermatophilus amargosae]
MRDLGYEFRPPNAVQRAMQVAATPAWALDLEADPRATVTSRNRTVEVVARPATDDEVEQVMAAAAPLHRGYAAYRRLPPPHRRAGAAARLPPRARLSSRLPPVRVPGRTAG